MKQFIIAFLALIPTTAFCQHSAYLPSGKKLPYKHFSINSLRDSLKLGILEGTFTPYGEVYYKKLTNKPVFLFFSKKDDLSKIPIMLKHYNYNKYLYSYDYYYDLKSMIEDNTLTKSYLLDAFGQPSIEATSEDGIPYWIFKHHNLRVEFENDLPKKADVINYRAYDLHQLAIIDYSITGESYSIGFDISFLNMSKKTIKYLYMTVTATNPVDDKIGTKTVRAIGPIKPNDSGSYNFENTFLSSSAQYLSLDAIKVQYMDGSIKLLSKSQVTSIQSTDWEEVGNRTIN